MFSMRLSLSLFLLDKTTEDTLEKIPQNKILIE